LPVFLPVSATPPAAGGRRSIDFDGAAGLAAGPAASPAWSPA
jgi:hypothetical protein